MDMQEIYSLWEGRAEGMFVGVRWGLMLASGARRGGQEQCATWQKLDRQVQMCKYLPSVHASIFQLIKRIKIHKNPNLYDGQKKDGRTQERGRDGG